MIACPRCKRNIPEKRTCIYCGALLTTAPAAIVGMNAQQWMQEGVRITKMGQLPRALSCFENVVKIEPDNGLGWFNKAVLLADLERFSEALASMEQAARLLPGNARVAKVAERLRSDPRAIIPAGRAYKSMLEMLSDGGPAQAYAIRGSAALFKTKRFFAGPEEIAVANWLADLPPEQHDAAGQRIWETGDMASQGMLFHVILRDRSAYTFRYATAAALPSSAVSDAELAGFGALLEAGWLKQIGLCSNCPGDADLLARIERLNARLQERYVPPPRRLACHIVEG